MECSECINDGRICGVNTMTNQNLDFLVDHKLILLVHKLKVYHVTYVHWLGYKRQSDLGWMFGQLRMVGYSFILVDYWLQLKMLLNVVKV